MAEKKDKVVEKPERVLVLGISEGSEAVGTLLAATKTFASGKSGFWGQAKLDIGGKRYQAQFQAVEIAPKA